ncbi:MAG: hypothetical protein KAJ19_02925 [Gammaproteobacteria bacterium]|nr:hypothetical protein [Gammaproteobacteria bacterium]
MAGFKAKPGCCEEASLFAPAGVYMPCDKPATKMVGWKNEGPYRMCDMCADHNIKNRNATTITIIAKEETVR